MVVRTICGGVFGTLLLEGHCDGDCCGDVGGGGVGCNSMIMVVVAGCTGGGNTFIWVGQFRSDSRTVVKTAPPIAVLL